jgi:hypothetical protein
MNRDEFLALVRPIWTEDLRQRQQKHEQRMRNLAAETAAKGIGASGAHIAAAFQVCAEESRTRARLARSVVRKAVTQTATRWTANELRSIYIDLITNMNRDVDASFENVVRIMPQSGDILVANRRALGGEQVAIIEQQCAELALFAAAPETPAREPGSVTVHGSVFGTVQTGDAAHAEVVVHIDSANAAVLREAVAALRRELRSGTIEVPSYADAVLEDLERESSRAEPEPKRIVALLGAASSVVGTIANVPGAWESVRHAAQAIGLPLP